LRRPVVEETRIAVRARPKDGVNSGTRRPTVLGRRAERSDLNRVDPVVVERDPRTASIRIRQIYPVNHEPVGGLRATKSDVAKISRAGRDGRRHAGRECDRINETAIGRQVRQQRVRQRKWSRCASDIDDG